MFANKQDLLGLLPDDIIKLLNLNNIKERAWSINSCSAIKGEGKLQLIRI